MAVKIEQTLSSLRKAAILMVSLDTDTACAIMSKLDTETIEKLSLEIARLDDISPEVQDAVVEEFYSMGMARQFIERGGIGYAKELLEKTLTPEEANRIIDEVQGTLESAPFSFLKKTPADSLATFLLDEHPQTIALVLCYLRPMQAAQLLQELPAAKQLEVTRRIATMEDTSPEVIREVEIGLRKRLSSLLNQELEDIGGASAVADILNYADRSTEKQILEGLEEEDPELVEEVRRMMFVFEDLQLVDQRGMQEVLKEIDNDTLALALKGATDEMRDKFFAAMSKRAATLVRENMEFLGPVRVTDVEKAQQEIVDVVRRLADAGTITISERGSTEEMIV